MVAVPAYPPAPRRPSERLNAILADVKAACVLTTLQLWSDLQERFKDQTIFRSLKWLPLDPVQKQTDDSWQPPALENSMLAMIQYTSGSTTTPRGVMLTHGNLLHNLSLIYRYYNIPPESRGVSWLPPYHDMGLIGGILQPLYAGYPITLMSPAAFLQRPYRWLQAISRTGAMGSVGPNFAYDLCVRAVAAEQRSTLDLSAWKIALSGAEPIRHETIERFCAAFGPCGFSPEAFYPCYGLAEATLIVSGKKSPGPPSIWRVQSSALEKSHILEAQSEHDTVQVLVGCGEGMEGQSIAIVDPDTLRRCPSDQVGEIWILGPSVAQGYWNREEETAKTFGAFIADANEGPYLRTGDLGFLKERELVVTGRLKDLIIIRGRNHYPQDIEQTVELACPLLRPGRGAAFSIEAAGQERLVVVYEVTRHYRDLNLDEVIRGIRQAVAERHEVQVYAVTLLRPGSIPSTSSGKIQRHLCRAGFLSGSLNSITTNVLDATNDAPTEEGQTDMAAQFSSRPLEERRQQVQSHLEKIVSQVLKIPVSQLDEHSSLSMLGLDSLTAFEIKAAIEDEWGVELPFADLFQQKTLSQIVQTIIDYSDNVVIRKPALALRPVMEDTSPLSYGQQALWFLYQLDPASPAYNISRAVSIEGELDVAALQWALQVLVERHASLRTGFVASNGLPSLKIHANVAFRLTVYDRSFQDEDALLQHLVDRANAPFNLAEPPLIRAELFRCDENRSILLLVIHHIIADYWSLIVLVHELNALYSAKKRLISPSLAPLDARYTDYIQWQRDMAASPEGKRHWTYWQQQLAGDLPILQMPTDYSRPAIQRYFGATSHFRINQRITSKLKLLCQQENVTLYTALLAAFQVLLYRYTNQDDIIVGTPTAGRNHRKFFNLIGYFVNPVVLRARLSAGMPFRIFLHEVWRTVLEAFEHEDYPFSLLVEQLQPKRDRGHSPLFQVSFALQTAPPSYGEDLAAFALGAEGARLTLGDLSITSINLETRNAQFDLVLLMAENAGELLGSFQYNTDIFTQATIERLEQQYQVLLASILTEVDQQIAKLPLLEDEQLETILYQWNATDAEYARHTCIHQLFEKQVLNTPDALAAIYKDSCLTYQQLNEQANKLAHHLISLGVRSGVLVAVYMERSLAMIVALLGILKAGGAYVPLETGFPQERLRWILSTLDVQHMVTNGDGVLLHLHSGFLENVKHIICLDVFELQSEQEPIEGNGYLVANKSVWTPLHIEMQSGENPPLRSISDDLAYIIFTSGSTGTPKGVMVCHKPVINLIEWVNATFRVGPLDRVLFITSLCFDLSVYDIFGLLAAGGSIHIVPQEDLHEPERLIQLLGSEPVTFWDSAPPALQQLVPFFPNLNATCTHHHLRLVFLSGDWIPVGLPELVRQVFPGTAVVSLGGATEATVWSNYYPIEQVDPTWVSIPYGKPIQNARYYVLDAYLHPCPIGVPGDLYIGGECLSLGYVQEPAFTAEKYLPDPFTQRPGARLYKTGDRARYRPDGNLEFLGRLDHQVKIRGFRIELAEIEIVLSQHSAVQDTSVIVKDFAGNDRRLVAYIVPDRQYALPVCQMLHLENLGMLKGRNLYELPNAMVIAQQNRNETEFMYNSLLDEEKNWQEYGITLKDGDCVFDVGANIGLFSLFVNRRYADLHLFAFEPIPAVFDVLRFNMELYAVPVQLFNCGLSNQAANQALTYYPRLSLLSGKFANIHNERETLKSFLAQQNAAQDAVLDNDIFAAMLEERLVNEQVTCQMRTLSQVIEEHNIEQIDLLKIDVEKSERDVLQGIAEKDWPKIKQIVVEVYDVDGRLEEIVGLLEEQGYVLSVVQEMAIRGTAFYNIYARRVATSSPSVDARQANDERQQRDQMMWCSRTELTKDIKQFLKNRLPEYMLPAHFILLETLPLTPNGKVDRRALAEIVQDEIVGEARVAPRTAVEQRLAEIWSAVLGLHQIGIDEDFFNLGGHSLLATQIVARIQDEFQIKVPLHFLFEKPNIRELASIIEEIMRQGTSVSGQAIIATSREEHRVKKSSLLKQKTAARSKQK